MEEPKRWYAAVLLMAALLASNGVGAESVKVGGSGTLLGAMRVLGEAYEKAQPDVHISIVANLGSGGGIRALAGGALDIALNSRPLKASERKSGVEAMSLGRTPFVFVVAERRRETALTQPEVLAAFDGTRTHWSDGMPIRLSLRPADDSDNDALDAWSPAMKAARLAAHRRPGMFFALSDQQNADYLERTPGALGAVSLAVILSEGRGLRPLRLDGVAPTPAALAAGEYKLSKPLYLVVGQSPSPAARRFIDFVFSSKGRQLLERVGIVPERAAQHAR